jgi:hypothetical protein
MRAVLVFIIILSINFVNSNRILSLNSDDDSKVTKLVGKLINEATQKLTGIQDVAILDMVEGNSKGFGDAKREIAKHLLNNPVTFLPSKGPTFCPRKFSIAIIFLEDFDDVRALFHFHYKISIIDRKIFRKL